MSIIDQSGSSTDYDLSIDIPSSATQVINKEQLKLKFTVIAHGVTKTHLAGWWSNFGFAKETVSDETFSVSNFVSCAHCFTTYRYGSSSTESTSRHKCHGLTSSCKPPATENSFTLDKHVIKQKNSFRLFEQQHLTKMFTNWISDNLRPISIVEDPGLREIC
ncbi:unnamed protein product [Rotaria magnacalcarata]|uniref:Uncharacterized protein n=1 Tax=Rotaria magnacalcarata TaxID=392030 RepID=A0A819ST31_9BILA|nr:unnamed protein product [Rotaria magnacalcarata]CAF1585628.1 unnamed protein product [Rotaria magnacalcarata]CAF2223392.1 unnamed protein product [Rotaria magnacalcarata]CAF2230631.1 unnamed protein product [Rotaria magnacalcarata]CAF4065028.1 unnamed protein product [Rotaria magnacalcarata]